MAAGQASELGELRLGERQTPEDHVGVLNQRQARVARMHAALRASNQLRADLAPEQ